MTIESKDGGWAESLKISPHNGETGQMAKNDEMCYWSCWSPVAGFSLRPDATGGFQASFL